MKRKILTLGPSVKRRKRPVSVVKPLTKRQKRRLTERWMMEFKLFSEGLTPWAIDIHEELRCKHKDGEIKPFSFRFVREALHHMRRRKTYSTNGTRYHIDGSAVE